LSGSENSARSSSGAETPAWPDICRAPLASMEVRGSLRSRAAMDMREVNSPPHRQRAASLRCSSESGCDCETKRVKPAPVSVVTD